MHVPTEFALSHTCKKLEIVLCKLLPLVLPERSRSDLKADSKNLCQHSLGERLEGKIIFHRVIKFQQLDV